MHIRRALFAAVVIAATAFSTGCTDSELNLAYYFFSSVSSVLESSLSSSSTTTTTSTTT